MEETRKRRPKKGLAPWILFAYFWIAGALPELVLHISTADSKTALYSSGLLLAPLFAAVPACVAYALVRIFRYTRLSAFFASAYGVLAFALCASQLIYYRVFGCFYSAFSMANGGQVLQFWNIVLKKFFTNILWLALMSLPAVLFIWKLRRQFRFRGQVNALCMLLPLAIAVVIEAVTVISLPIYGKDALSAYDLYHNEGDAYYSINKLGFAASLRLDASRLISDKKGGGTIDIVSGDPFADDVPDETLPPEIDTSPNTLGIDFEALASSASDSKIKEVHQYFAGRTASNKNAYTGLFKGCNLILITGEAFSDLIVTQERTPTLYKMMHEGIYFSNYYVPDWGTSTTDGEYAFLTGTVPKSGTWSFAESSDNSMPLTMVQQLKKQGYNAYAYHGHTYNYYKRNKYLENLGYTYRAYGQGLDVKKTWPESDVEVVEKSVSDYASNEPFTAYYMSISGHREFTFTGNYIAYKNKSLVQDEPYSANVRAYIACQLELEKSLELLMQQLEAAGTLNNTVFVLTADHYPNGLTNEELSELAGHTIETNFEIYKNGCVLYKPGMTPITVDEPCSHLDLLPTLSNLFGLEFDSRLYMGRDVFSGATPFVMFRNRSWITDKASYNNSTKEVVNLSGEALPDNYAKNISKELNNRFTVSTRILEYNYWKILFG